MEYDCCLTKDDKWFRYRAAAIIIEEGYILFVKDIKEKYYYSVGGGVHIGESAEEAVKREVLEETGVEYEVDRLAFIHENFFTGNGELEGKKCHEIALYFLMKSKGTRDLINNRVQDPEEEVCWLPVNELNKFKTYPSFFEEKLNDIAKNIEHIVKYEY